MDVIEEIRTERERQIERFGIVHDDEHNDGALAKAASMYAEFADDHEQAMRFANVDQAPAGWPWSWHWWKPEKGPRRMLIKAAALIVAEIERLDRVQ